MAGEYCLLQKEVQNLGNLNAQAEFKEAQGVEYFADEKTLAQEVRWMLKGIRRKITKNEKQPCHPLSLLNRMYQIPKNLKKGN